MKTHTHLKNVCIVQKFHDSNKILELRKIFNDSEKWIVTACNSHEALLEACKEARVSIYEALGDLTDHFTIKHIKGCLETLEECIKKAEG